MSEERGIEEEDLGFCLVNESSNRQGEAVQNGLKGGVFLHRGVTKEHVIIDELLVGNRRTRVKAEPFNGSLYEMGFYEST